jgi:hypothetical protein
MSEIFNSIIGGFCGLGVGIVVLTQIVWRIEDYLKGRNIK